MHFTPPESPMFSALKGPKKKKNKEQFRGDWADECDPVQ